MRVNLTNKQFNISVPLVGSKSESNRALMICHYGKFAPIINNLSTADDTILLSELLKDIDNSTAEERNTNQEPSCKSCSSCLITISCQNAGTVFRFLATALSMTFGSWLLTGSERMQKRPVKPLVDSLRQLGADVEYQSVEGFPPLIIKGQKFQGGSVSVDVSRSSQYASSLLLAAPTFEKGLHLHLDGEMTSMPYIDMTIKIMSEYGAKIHREGRDIFVKHSDYQNIEYEVESDWSAASYWYEMVALSDGGKAFLQNLNLQSDQGDKVVADIFNGFGVTTIAENQCVTIEKTNSNSRKEFEFDFVNTPDLFPAVIATCAGLKLNAKFKGLKNLAIKESNRVEAMISELRKIGVEFEMVYNDTLKMKALQNMPSFSNDNPVVFDSHNDHRIAMALAPLSLKIGAVGIENAEAVSKSYPNFWDDFSKISMDINMDM